MYFLFGKNYYIKASDPESQNNLIFRLFSEQTICLKEKCCKQRKTKDYIRCLKELFLLGKIVPLSFSFFFLLIDTFNRFWDLLAIYLGRFRYISGFEKNFCVKEEMQHAN